MIDPIILWFKFNAKDLGYLTSAVIFFLFSGVLTTAFWFGSRKLEFFHELYDEWEEYLLRSHEGMVTTFNKLLSPRHSW